MQAVSIVPLKNPLKATYHPNGHQHRHRTASSVRSIFALWHYWTWKTCSPKHLLVYVVTWKYTTQLLTWNLSLYLAFKTANAIETWRCHLVWWIVSYYCACWCCWYPKVAPFKCMLIKSRGVLFLLVQRFEALPTGIRSDTIRTASVLNGFKTLSLRPE